MMISKEILLDYGASVKAFHTDEIIFSEGSTCQYYFQLRDGRVRWTNINDDGKEYLQTMIEPGESFGELPLFDDGVYAASAIADCDCEVYRLPIEIFRKLIADYPKIHFNFSRLLAERLRYKFLLVKEFAYTDPEHRVETLLKYLKETGRNICPDCTLIKLTRQQIADMTGLRVETVIRVMRTMHENHKLIIQKGKVYLNMTGVICRGKSENLSSQQT